MGPDEALKEAGETSKAIELENPMDLAQEDGGAPPPKPVKRRPERTISDFDKQTNTHHERNRQRTRIILIYALPNELRYACTSLWPDINSSAL